MNKRLRLGAFALLAAAPLLSAHGAPAAPKPTACPAPVPKAARCYTGEDGTGALADTLAREDGGVPGVEARHILASVSAVLSDRDRRILYLRFFEQRTQHEIADEIGVTQMQVSRLLSRILADLRKAVGT